ncbi:hypothetical protein GCM10022222_42380 [Amycolatopsis ultiminotia]|uniref:Uncharacterized protein n=1 Tax=Amycolatopsis ultiminotia TaxID=543629 RepID=A0ABP6WQL3_9PSEU
MLRAAHRRATPNTPSKLFADCIEGSRRVHVMLHARNAHYHTVPVASGDENAPDTFSHVRGGVAGEGFEPPKAEPSDLQGAVLEALTCIDADFGLVASALCPRRAC